MLMYGAPSSVTAAVNKQGMHTVELKCCGPTEKNRNYLRLCNMMLCFNRSWRSFLTRPEVLIRWFSKVLRRIPKLGLFAQLPTFSSVWKRFCHSSTFQYLQHHQKSSDMYAFRDENSLCTTTGFTSFNASSEMQNYSFLQHLEISYKRKRITARRIPFVGCFRRIDGTGVWSTALLNLHVAAM